MWRIKVIEDNDERNKAITYLEALMDKTPVVNTEEDEKIKLISLLIDNYEKERFNNDILNPIDAIRFRMEQMEYSQADLAKITGYPASRISEILAGKRTLTTGMVKDFSESLDIPIHSLMGVNGGSYRRAYLGRSKLIRQMKARGYFGNNEANDDIIDSYFANLDQSSALLRRSRNRITKATDPYALMAWLNKVQKRARSKEGLVYNQNLLTREFLGRLVKLSTNTDGGVHDVISELARVGVTVVVEPHLDKTRLDGALILEDLKHPVIGLTLRYDRLDYFWFTLMHELAHLYLHFDQLENGYIFDEIEEVEKANIDKMEQEADKFAAELLIPSEAWVNAPARVIPSGAAAEALARALGINVAIVAGRMRKESNKWQKLVQSVSVPVRQYFKNIDWERK